MTHYEQYDAEIAATVTKWDKAGKALHPTWISHAICKKHKAGLVSGSKHALFWEHCTYKQCRQDTSRFITKHYGDNSGADDREDRQPVFPGFEHVQRRYVVKRDGDEVAVLAEDLTDDEIDARALLLRRRGKSCEAHAKELIRFKSWRREQHLKAAAE